MQFLTTILATLAAVASADVLSNDWANAGTCAQKNPAINTAIQNFCANQGIVAPSTYATDGVWYGGINVKIISTCNPPQWVPTYYCTAQFHAVCAHHEHGIGMKYYGNENCQLFVIDE